MELPPPKPRRIRESVRSSSPTVERSRPIDREMRLSPLSPKSIGDSAASSSSGLIAKLSDLDPKTQMYALKACQEECQLLQDQIRDLDRSIERADEHVKGLQSETSLSAKGLTKCLAKKEKMELKLTKLRKKEEDLNELCSDLKTLEKIQKEEITDLTIQFEALQRASESIGVKIQSADQKAKVLDEENKNLQTMMEGSDRLLPFKKRNTLSGDKSKHSTGTSTKGN